jgi:hypothetical protein
MFWLCGCGRSGTKSFSIATSLLCPLCNQGFKPKEDFNLGFYFDDSGKKRKVKFIDLDESYLNPREKQVLDVIKSFQPVSNKDIKNYLNFEDVCMVTGRTNALRYDFNIPFIIPFSREKEVGQPIKWIINPQLNKSFDVEREIEAKVMNNG